MQKKRTTQYARVQDRSPADRAARPLVGLGKAQWQGLVKGFIIAAMVCSLALLGFSLFPRNTDFTGQRRLHLPEDVAYGACRALEEETGIQIFYLPEWAEKEDGFLRYSDFDRFSWDGAYFRGVLAELEKMGEAFRRYPRGFLRELVEKKDGRGEGGPPLLHRPGGQPVLQPRNGPHGPDRRRDTGRMA